MVKISGGGREEEPADHGRYLRTDEASRPAHAQALVHRQESDSYGQEQEHRQQ